MMRMKRSFLFLVSLFFFSVPLWGQFQRVTQIKAGTNITLSPSNGFGVVTVTATGSGISGSGASGQVTFWTGATALAGDNNLLWDNTNKRLGIGVSPTSKLHVTGNAGTGNFVANIISGDAGKPILVQNTSASNQSSIDIQNDQGINSYLTFGTWGSTQSGTVFGQALANWSGVLSVGSNNNGFLLGTQTVKPIVIGTNNVEAMRITATSLIGIGTPLPTNILSLGGQSNQTFWMERQLTAATPGNNLTVQASGAVLAGTNLNGGNLNLSSGTSTGTGTSLINFNTASAGASGTVDNAPTTKISIDGVGNLFPATAGTMSLGKSNLPFSTLFWSGSSASPATNNFTVTGAATAARTWTFQDASDTVVGRATPDVFTNKTYDTAGVGNIFKIAGTQISAVTGTGSAVLATSPTLVTPAIGSATGASLALTGSSANILAAGLNGITNPAFSVDASTASQAAGLNVKGAATGGTVIVAAIDSGVNTSLDVEAKGTGVIKLGATSTGQISIGRGNLGVPIFSTTTASLGTIQNSTPTASQLLGGVVTQTSVTGAGTVTLPTGTLLSGAVTGVLVGDSFSVVFANLGGGFTLTITGATGSTVLGNAAIPSGKNASLLFVNTGANAWSVYVIPSA